MFRIISLAIGYFLGCIQWSYLIGKYFYHIDIREHGSGSAGSTNAVRTMGAKAGLAVFALDIIKAAGAFMIATFLFKSRSVFTADLSLLGVLPGLYGGFGAVVGHNFPFYLKFKGGKGMASTVGTILLLPSWIPWVCYAFAISLVAASRYVSVASLSMTAVLPVLIIFAGGFGTEASVVSAAMGVLCWFKHKENIKRLIQGNERKFNFRKEK